LTVKNSTFSGNSASVNGGGLRNTNALSFANTIIANSLSGGDCSGGDVNTNINNLVEDGGCSSNGSHFLSGVEPNLDSLADNGGPTQTMALLAGSPAIDAGDTTTCAASPVNALDQRGVTRPVGASCDIGAYEGAKDITAPTVLTFGATSPSTSLAIPIAPFTASDNVLVTGYKITTSSAQPLAGDLGWTGSAPSSYTVDSDGSYTLYPWVKDAGGNVSAVYGSPASVTVDASAPNITVNNPDTTPALSKTITASVSDGTLTMSNTIGSICNGTLTFTVYASQIFSLESDNGTKVCYKAVDALGNTGYSLSNTIAGIDTTAPTVVSSVRVNSNPTTAASVDFIVTFSESVSGVDVADFSLTTTGSISGAVVSGVSGSGATYTVTVNTGSGSGTIRLDVADNDTIVDASSKPLGGSSAGNGAFTSGEAYTIPLHRIYLPLVIGK